MTSDDLPIGRRVARWRVRRRMTQQMLADRLGRSKSWVDKMERGVRALDRYPVIQEIAQVLRVDPMALLGPHQPPAPSTSQALDGLDGIRAALARYDNPPPQPTGEVRRHIEHAWLTYQHGHYPQLVRVLPGLLDATRSAEPGLRVQAYRITSSLLVKLGEADLAWLAADRAMGAAGGDPVLSAAAAVSVGVALRALGRHRLALAATLAAAGRLAPVQAPAVHGTLLLQAALAAAGSGDARRAGELTDRAAGIAAGIRAGDDPHRTGFGTAAVELARVVVAAELGDDGAALHSHGRLTQMPGWRRQPAEHRAAYRVDVARAYLAVGDLRGAARALVEADAVAPAEVRCRPQVRRVIAEIARGHPAPAGAARLATLVGLTR
ncbi:Transcriptional regulator, contains XRE-family HTH domain [Micromonospora echinaurantiaca]|uniref:Transcriptional regulator, contains XRE-family HTH domain n=1 Tax=Micromonospora echinaurantiaca TaxID=47857 RepID=A0A1C5HSM1_9ACTN|nr:helix-turn-helix transcriptional regulator [Micromonospora echinaurantiaca]SCG49000.1 Transcriptional regulator, contains XRE-family HTH domain [Micromonospora echinaurantiaca]